MSIPSTGLSHGELHGVKPLSVTFKRAGELSGLGQTTLWKLAKERRLTVIHVDRRALITFASLEQLLAPAETTA